VLIVAADSALTVLIGRGLEGVGAGLFIASSLSWVNSRPDHERLSGYFMASLNLGLVVGLIGTGWLVLRLGDPDAGLILFTALAVIPTVMSFSLCDGAHEGGSRNRLRDLLIRYAWLWYSSVVLIGVTGVVTALYPAFSGNKPDLLGIQIASMGVATVGAVLIVSHLSLPPVRTIRTAAVLMAAGVLICFVSPWGFVILGALAGTVQIAQMAFLAESRDMQGAAMGLFSAMSYAGMTFLPFLSGLIADRAGFFVAFTATALIAMSVAVTIGRCKQSCAE
jgi:MFS family permease